VTIGEVRGYAIGILGMTIKDFGECRVGILDEAIEAHNNERNSERKHIAELIRGATLRLFNLQLEKKNRYRSVEDFWPMPWDEKCTKRKEADEKFSKMTDEERKEAAKKFIQRINGK